MPKPKLQDIKFEDKDFTWSSGCNKPYFCVEVAIKKGGVAIRDSKNRQQSPLLFTRKEWAAFSEGVKRGEFDLK